MLRTGIERELRGEHEEDDYLFPDYKRNLFTDYERYCFGDVPDTERSVLNAEGRRPLPGDVFGGVDTGVDTVVLVIVDGYGLDSWERVRPRNRPELPGSERTRDWRRPDSFSKAKCLRSR